MDGVEEECERVFMVGELVEFWVGPVARAYLTDSGAPAYVKEIHGLGWYGIKMVGSFGGRNRRVHWKSLFKDSTFRKEVVRLDGARVRTKARMQERAQEEAEAKIGEELRETRRKLQRQEKETIKKQKQAEAILTAQVMEARKAEKLLTAGHKRDLAVMRGNLKRTTEERTRAQEELVRAVRQKTRQTTKELDATQEDLKGKTETNETLRMAVRKGAEKLERLRVDGLLWKSKYVAGKAEVMLREEQRMKAAAEQREWDRAGEGATRRSANVVAELRANLDAAAAQAQVTFFCLRPLSFFLFMTPWHMFRWTHNIWQS
jgi:hypothetical protein